MVNKNIIKKGMSKANINLALVKYWGKKDEERMLPFYDSISITLNNYYSVTQVSLNDNISKDQVYFHGEFLKYDNDFYIRVVRFLNLFRNKYNLSSKVVIKTWNFVPTSSGMASSASGYASLALALVDAYKLKIDLKEVSQIARLGSVSASRSIYGDIVLLNTNSSEPYSEPFAKWPELRVIVFDTVSKKAISSREAMHMSVNNPNYNNWINRCLADLTLIKESVKKQDFTTFGKTVQSNAVALHALINESNISYLTNDSFKVINLIEEVQKSIPIYYTMDAGSIVFGITLDKYIPELNKILSERCSFKYDIISSGNGVVIL